jgi:4-hydroxyacetophenone monooxygenase
VDALRVTEQDRQSVSAAELVAALRHGNIPTLVPVLYQLTGDRKWLSPRFQPTRTRGMDDHPTGGLAEDAQDELRRATAEAVMSWAAGTAVAVPGPRGDELMELMSVCMGEEVPPEYEEMTAEEMGLTERLVRTIQANPADLHPSVTIIGAGVSGLAMSRDLVAAGIKHVILEKSADVGGTWLNNRYPGCGVDTPSYLYSYSFFQREWSQHFAKRAELATYLSDMAKHFALLDNIRFGVELISAAWDDDARSWRLQTRTRDGVLAEHTTSILITAVGQLSQPKFPAISGLDTFTGAVFHSARWPDNVDLHGKRVAVVGTGASSMQIVPAIVNKVGQLGIFQRSPQWVAPNDYYFTPIGSSVHYLMKHVPFYYEWYRFRLGWTFNDKVHRSLQKDPGWPLQPRSINEINEGHRGYFERYLRAQLAGRPDLIEKALPDYPPFGKRMLLDNGWFAALKQPNVELTTQAVVALSPTGVVTEDGSKWAADIVILATGYEAQRPTYPIELHGRDGLKLREAWHDDDAHAYLGVSTPKFPNLFFLYGPNTSLGHGGSFMFLAERAANYLIDLLCRMIEAGIEVIEVKEAANDAYNASLDQAHERMIWTQPGFTTWYVNSRRRVVTNMPWRVVDYWGMTRTASLDDYETTPPAVPTALPAEADDPVEAV